MELKFITTNRDDPNLVINPIVKIHINNSLPIIDEPIPDQTFLVNQDI